MDDQFIHLWKQERETETEREIINILAKNTRLLKAVKQFDMIAYCADKMNRMRTT